MGTKQNRSTEGCSRLKRSVDMTSSGKNGLNINLFAIHGLSMLIHSSQRQQPALLFCMIFFYNFLIMLVTGLGVKKVR